MAVIHSTNPRRCFWRDDQDRQAKSSAGSDSGEIPDVKDVASMPVFATGVVIYLAGRNLGQDDRKPSEAETSVNSDVNAKTGAR